MAAAAAVMVHPVTDRDVSKIHRPEHDGSEDTWQAFVYQVDVYSDDIDANYVLSRDQVARANQIAALGHDATRVQTDQNRIYSMLKSATSKYAAAEIETINRGAINCGSDLWNLLNVRFRAADVTARVTRKDDLTVYAQEKFKHDDFEKYFDQIKISRNIVNSMG